MCPENQEGSLPEANLASLAQMLYLQGMMATGQMPNPATGKPDVDLSMAGFQVELLEMLQKKTENNRTAEEDHALDDMLHSLRMLFIDATKQ